MLAGHKHVRGFTIVELLMVITIIGILSAVVISYAQSTQLRARDIERASDVAATAKQFERRYRLNASVTGPTYPSTADIGSGSILATMQGAEFDIAIAPRQTASSIIAASSTVSQTPTIDQYVYQPFTSTNTLCTATPCVRFVLYYRLELDGSIVKIESLRQQ